jgi:asparagine synthase (glutamine-hydrolysing)
LFELQPLAWREPPLALTADARLDNREELIPALGLRGRPPGQVTDAELLLASYAAWGERCVDRLRGDFAFAVWDARDRTLFLARDPFGVKPLYFHRTPRLVAFATEIKGVLALPQVPRGLNELQVAYYLESIVDDREITFYESIVRLPAGHWLRVGLAPMRAPVRYVHPERIPDVRLPDDRAYAEAFRERFTEAVRHRVRCAFPVGSMLSGGLDSSSIACTARDLSRAADGGAIHALSAVFPGLPEPARRLADETEYIDAVIATGGFVHHRVRADLLSPLGDVDAMLRYHDQPPLGYNLYMHRGLFGPAQAAGVRVLLDGLDGDTCVGHGLERLGELAVAAEWDAFEREVRALCAATGASGASGASGGRPGPYVRAFAFPRLDALARGHEWTAWWRATRTLHARFGLSRRQLAVAHGLRPLLARGQPRSPAAARPEGEPRVLDRRFARRVGFTERLRALSHVNLGDGPDDQRVARDPSAYQYALEMGDHLAGAFSLEVRYPFFDRGLYEFCAGLPASQRLDGGWTRVVLRRAMAGILPPAIQWRRTKQDLSPNFNRALRAAGDGPAETGANSPLARLQGYVDPARLRRAFGRLASGPAGLRQSQDAMLLFRATVLARWLERT